MTRSKLAVLGAGRLGQSIGRILGKRAEIALWSRSEARREEAKQEVPGVPVVDSVKEAVEGASIVFIAVPATAMLEVANLYGDYARGDHVVLLGSRGVGPDFMLPHEMVRAKTCVRKIAVVGGPLHTRDLGSGRRMSAIVASRFGEPIRVVRALVEGGPLTVHASNDIVGVEIAGAISNASAIAAGMADALDLGDTARGMLLVHGLTEARRLGEAVGAQSNTFAGLAGVGDLIPRKVTSTERHNDLGERLAKGESLDDALSAIQGEVEGVTTVRAAAAKAKAAGMQLPLIGALEAIFERKAEPRDALERVLSIALEL